MQTILENLSISLADVFKGMRLEEFDKSDLAELFKSVAFSAVQGLCELNNMQFYHGCGKPTLKSKCLI